MRILVTGGTKGIGRAIVERAVSSGASVIATFHSDEVAAEQLAMELGVAPGCLTLVKGGVGSQAEVDALVSEVLAAEGQLDAIVHCAVDAMSGTLLGASRADLDESLAINGASLLWLIRATGERLSEGGSVVYLTSQGARDVVADYGLIGPPKAYAEACARYLAVELAPRGIAVNIVESGPVDTASFRSAVQNPDRVLQHLRGRTPLAGVDGLTSVASVVVSVLRGELPGMTGQRLVIDGGLTLLA